MSKETIRKYTRQANRLKKRAAYLGSTRGLIRATIKGIPAAAKKVFSLPKGKPTQMSKALKGERQSNLNKIQRAVQDYKSKNPGFKVPRYFK